jgi:hypothetical protein
VKTTGVWVLSSFLSVAAHGGAIATIPPSQSTFTQAGHRDLPAEKPQHPKKRTPVPAPATTDTFAGMSADLAAYLFLHETRDASVAGRPVTRMKACYDGDYQAAAQGNPK